MQANDTSYGSKGARLPRKSYRLEQAFEDFNYQISIRTDGAIGNEWLSIQTVKIPHEKYGWVDGGEISFPLPLYPKFKEALTQWEAAMGTAVEQGDGIVEATNCGITSGQAADDAEGYLKQSTPPSHRGWEGAEATSQSKNEKMPKANNLVRISQADGLPVRKSTLCKWMQLTERPEMFVKSGGAVYVDLNAFE
jgi:hypothetical protein